jgi:hypothetical protein
MGCGRVNFQTPGIDRFAAFQAFAIETLIHSPQRIGQCLQLTSVSALQCQLHLLLLHGIHPGKSANPALIQLNRMGIRAGGGHEQLPPSVLNTPSYGFMVSHDGTGNEAIM